MHPITLVIATILLALWPARIQAQCDQCKGDFNGDGQVTVDEIIVAVNNALNTCPTPGPRFVDNADGTLTDTTTNLMWEKKSDDGSVHDKDTTYTWSVGAPYDADGETFTSFLATLNAPPCFAGHCDWRLPTLIELQGLADYARFAPAIDPLFTTPCTSGCAVTACSCTTLDNYWSATTGADITLAEQYAWVVDANYGYTNLFDKTLPSYARAVRRAP